jgi:hypothetical protein
LAIYGEEWRKIAGLTEIAIDGRSLSEMDEDRQRWPKFLTARCVMLANITGFGRPAFAFLTRLWLDESVSDVLRPQR